MIILFKYLGFRRYIMETGAPADSIKTIFILLSVLSNSQKSKTKSKRELNQVLSGVKLNKFFTFIFN